MNQEQQTKLEQVAQRKWEEDQATNPTPVNPHAYVYGFKAGAQTILDNPQEWGLACMKASDKCWYEVSRDLYGENQRYREALERAYNDFKSSRWTEETYKIVIEALKQQGDEINKK